MAITAWGNWAWDRAQQMVVQSLAAKAGNSALNALDSEKRESGLQQSAGYAAVAGVLNTYIRTQIAIPNLVAGGAAGAGLMGLATACKPGKAKIGCLQVVGAGILYTSSYAPEKWVTTAAQVYTVASLMYVLGAYGLKNMAQGNLLTGAAAISGACFSAATLGVFASNLLTS